MGVLKPLPCKGRGLERGQSIHSKLFKHPLIKFCKSLNPVNPDSDKKELKNKQNEYKQSISLNPVNP
jgi:hypothetical protein